MAAAAADEAAEAKNPFRSEWEGWSELLGPALVTRSGKEVATDAKLDGAFVGLYFSCVRAPASSARR